MKTKTSQFTQLFARLKYEFKEYQVFFSECLQEQSNYSYYLQNIFSIWYYIYSRTILDLHSFYSKFVQL